jgi:hypothetical protein
MIAAPGKEKGVLSLLTVAFPRQPRGPAIPVHFSGGYGNQRNFERH